MGRRRLVDVRWNERSGALGGGEKRYVAPLPQLELPP